MIVQGGLPNEVFYFNPINYRNYSYIPFSPSSDYQLNDCFWAPDCICLVSASSKFPVPLKYLSGVLCHDVPVTLPKSW